MCFVGTVKPIIKEQHKVLKSLPLLATGVDKAGKREGVNGNAGNHHNLFLNAENQYIWSINTDSININSLSSARPRVQNISMF